ncbi:4a-hydroxytetrahydrobiopterin dehydratase [Aeromicrobium sp. Leaf350]|uniref:4a-hydroxytetrahydrobiopterin dehydratase n=1 Tax=Aeromicrobium sp. Leaf350 TaxID=2876565 RepID=UPI001E3E759B|nr:4a-hydroxytetrahydrobiopterin dehydratase [Aeromicrobium sp. Leaf350]
MAPDTTPVKTTDVLDAGLDDWVLAERWLHARFTTSDFAAGLALVNAIGAAAEDANHHPDVTLRYGHVDVHLRSHDAGDLTSRDVDMARRISELAAEHGVTGTPSAVRLLSLALDAADIPAVGRFWSAAFTGAPDNVDEDDVVDPDTHELVMWLQQTDPHAEPRQRFHLDLWVAPDAAEARIAAIVDAGGVLVSDDEAPSFTVLADPEGNKVCICTCLDRRP